jgi:hypothetical protein
LDWRNVCQTGWIVINQKFSNEILYFVQLKDGITPTFEAAHGPGYQALIMVDHSQGHASYAADALLTSWMNLRPGGKQACLQDGWYMVGDKKIIQSMNFPENHAMHPGKERNESCSGRTWPVENRSTYEVQDL